jgi:steroid 5-alpha reductase family enzyme
MINLLVTATWVMMALMTAVYVLSLQKNNYSYVDVAWGLGFSLMAFVGFCGAAAPIWLVGPLAGMMALHSLRLGSHLWRRVAGHPEEGRYQALRQQWNKAPKRSFFLFFQAQAWSVVLLALPLWLVALDAAATKWGVLQMMALALFILAWLGESLADAQLRHFKKGGANANEVCKKGLWRYSRHPNYFFEILIWVSFALYASGSPWGWLAWGSPLIIVYLILKVTGVPPTEAQSLLNKGEAYVQYQKETSVLFPWFPKRIPPPS